MSTDAVTILASWFGASGDSGAGTTGGDTRRRFERFLRDTAAAPSLSADDAALLQRIQANDESAFETWYLRDYAVVWKFAARFVASYDAAEDLTQDVFIAVWNRRATLDVRTGLRAYLLSAVRHRALNVIRDDARRGQLMEECMAQRGSPEAAPGISRPPVRPDEEAELNELQQRVRQALAALPERQRTALILRLEQTLSNVEIARMLGVGTPAVSRLLTRAIEALRRQL